MLLLYNAFTRTVLAPLDRATEELENEESEADSETTKDLEDWFFIPFPGTIKQIPQLPFRGTDPEWEAYVKFNKDRPLQIEVRSTDHLVLK